MQAETNPSLTAFNTICSDTHLDWEYPESSFSLIRNKNISINLVESKRYHKGDQLTLTQKMHLTNIISSCTR